MLYEDTSLISDPHLVADTFNEYFINVTQDTCEPKYISNMEIEDIMNHYENHPSIKLIKESHASI